VRRYLILVMLAVGCESSTPPTHVTTVPHTTTSAPRSPETEPFSWERYRGFSAFALAGKSAPEITATWSQARAAGFNTARVCSETENWGDDEWHPRVARDPSSVERLLSTTAEVTGAQLLLMLDCTMKHSVDDAEGEAWTATVLEIVERGRYLNVALEVVNEWWHPFYFVSRASLERRLDLARRSGLQYGTDDHFCGGDRPLRHEFLGSVSFASFHPCRTDELGAPWDPGRLLLERLVGENGGLAILSETVAYDDSGQDCTGLFTCDRERIERYMARCETTAGCRFTFHSRAGLRATGYSWFPGR